MSLIVQQPSSYRNLVADDQTADAFLGRVFSHPDGLAQHMPEYAPAVQKVSELFHLTVACLAEELNRHPSRNNQDLIRAIDISRYCGEQLSSTLNHLPMLETLVKIWDMLHIIDFFHFMISKDPVKTPYKNLFFSDILFISCIRSLSKIVNQLRENLSLTTPQFTNHLADTLNKHVLKVHLGEANASRKGLIDTIQFLFNRQQAVLMPTTEPLQINDITKGFLRKVLPLGVWSDRNSPFLCNFDRGKNIAITQFYGHDLFHILNCFYPNGINQELKEFFLAQIQQNRARQLIVFTFLHELLPEGSFRREATEILTTKKPIAAYLYEYLTSNRLLFNEEIDFFAETFAKETNCNLAELKSEINQTLPLFIEEALNLLKEAETFNLLKALELS